MDYQEQAQSEMWDDAMGIVPQDTRRRLFVQGYIVNERNVSVYRIVGTRTYKVAVDSCELPGLFDWTVDALNAGKEAVA